MYPKSPPPSASRTVDGMDRETVCGRYHRKVMGLARRLADRLPADAPLAAEDLASHGALGLLEAFEHYDPEMGIRFSTFAEFRIRGAMLDAVRSADPRSRRQRHLARDLEEATRQLLLERGVPPEEDEVAARLGMDAEEWSSARQDLAPATWFELREEEGIARGEDTLDVLDARLRQDPQVFDHLASQQVRDLLRQAVDRLPERQHQCVLLYYGKDMSLAEIAAVYSVSVSRVSQILSEARAQLRKSLSSRIRNEDLDVREAI